MSKPDVDFAGKVAFVTGASRGVGKALALALARAGCDVVIASKTVTPDPRLPGTIGETAREVEALGRRALPIAVDVRDDAAVERAVKAALDQLGRVDFLVNNAGALFWRALADTPLKRFDLVVGVNVRGSFEKMRTAASAMISGVRHRVLSPRPHPIVAWLSMSVAGQRALAATFSPSSSAASPVAMSVIPNLLIE